MSETEGTRGWSFVVARWLGPAGFGLALVSAVTLPVVGVSCVSPEQAPIRVCYSGLQMVTGLPDVDTPGFLAPPDVERILFGPMPGVVRMLALLTAAVLLAGLLSGVIRPPFPRALVGTAAGFTGMVLLVAAELLAISQSNATRFSANMPFGGSGPGLGNTGPGFWLAIAILIVVGLGNLAALAKLRSAALDEEFRNPSGDPALGDGGFR